MNKLESAMYLVANNGSCSGIACPNCFGKGPNGCTALGVVGPDLSNEELNSIRLKAAEKYLADKGALQSWELDVTGVAELSQENKPIFFEAEAMMRDRRCIDNEWIRGVELLKTIGWYEVEHEDSARPCVSLLSPDSLSCMHVICINNDAVKSLLTLNKRYVLEEEREHRNTYRIRADEGTLIWFNRSRFVASRGYV